MNPAIDWTSAALAEKRERPRVLLLAANRWVSTARLAMVLTEMGCVVELVGPADHPALLTRAVRRLHKLDPLHPVPSLQRALARSMPDALIAADELMAVALEELWWTSDGRQKQYAALDQATRALIERSVGGVEMLGTARSRSAMITLAAAAGVAVPETMPVPRVRDVAAAMDRLGRPTVLKADVSSGGRGVVMVEDVASARKAWKALHRPVTLAWAVMRGLRYKEWAHVRQSVKGETREVSAQRLVAGSERTAMVVCHQGQVLACVCLEVVRTWEQRGPSSVLRVVNDTAMEVGIHAAVGRLGLSGFCGFDFMVEAATGQRLMLEMNLRPTQLAHLPLGVGRDLVAAYVRAMLELEVADRPAATSGTLIALFPLELQRDAASELLADAFHDVPWGEQRLMEYALRGVAGLPKEFASTRRSG